MIGLYAIVSQAPASLTGARGEPLRALREGELTLLAGEPPPPLTVEALRAYDAAARRIAEACDACLPARFGASAENEQALLELIKPREAELREALQLVRGREQMTLRIHGAPAPAQPATGSGTRYLEERRRANKLPELDPLREKLAGIVRAERIERHAKEGFLASVYHLIDRGESARYTHLVQESVLDKLHLTASGPWPAWSFAPGLGS